MHGITVFCFMVIRIVWIHAFGGRGGGLTCKHLQGKCKQVSFIDQDLSLPALNLNVCKLFKSYESIQLKYAHCIDERLFIHFFKWNIKSNWFNQIKLDQFSLFIKKDVRNYISFTCCFSKLTTKINLVPVFSSLVVLQPNVFK